METITRPSMRTALRLVALGMALVGVVFWLFGGPNLGWTKTSVALKKVDPVTEIEYDEWQQNFVPGVDFLGGTLGLAAVVFAVSWFATGNVNGEEKHPIQNS